MPPSVSPLGSRQLRNRYLLAADAVLFSGAVALALVLRFEGGEWPAETRRLVPAYLVVSLFIKISCLWAFGLYRRLWRHAGIAEVERLLVATAISGAACFVLGTLILPPVLAPGARVPLSVLAMDVLLSAAAAAAPRLAIRASSRRRQRRRAAEGRRALIVGAGAAGEMIVKELLGHPNLGLNPVAFVDDDVSKQGHRMVDLPVVGDLPSIPAVVRDYDIDEIVIAMPSASGSVVRQVVRDGLDAGVRARTVPGMFDIISGRVAVTALRQVEIQDLLRREPIQTDLEAVRSLAVGETVMVTGAGGSIGSELCRQLARLSPARLVLLGHGENSIFEIEHELRSRFPECELVPFIADVRDRDRLTAAFERYRPFSVFHAAAHKHVPLMEANPAEAVTNNVIGTRNLAELAALHRVEHFVLISTDKAVRPTNVMGATKRVAEQVVQLVAEREGRNFVAVRFGNVLGSRGSVVPTFLRQIREGGPITVTHPEMRRYFMTIPEAVQLVLQAGSMGQGAEVFVLDMGEPVRIVDLATDLIRLSGLEVGVDIEIRFTGTRPGEKLYEELFFNSESASPTEHPKVLRARNGSIVPGFELALDTLVEQALGGAGADDLRLQLRRLVPDYVPARGGLVAPTA